MGLNNLINNYFQSYTLANILNQQIDLEAIAGLVPGHKD
jgi:hypothetical protein